MDLQSVARGEKLVHLFLRLNSFFLGIFLVRFLKEPLGLTTSLQLCNLLERFEVFLSSFFINLSNNNCNSRLIPMNLQSPNLSNAAN